MDGQLKQLEDAAKSPLEPAIPSELEGALVAFDELVNLRLPPRKRFMPWLHEGGLVMVFGPRGIGKTHLQISLTAALTTGTPFLCWPISEPTGVLYVDGEMPIEDLRQRMTVMLPVPPRAPLYFLSGEVMYSRLERDLALSQVSSRDAVTALLDAHHDVRVVIIDNVSCLFPGIDEDKKRDWEPIAAWLISLRRRGLAVILVHHAGKGGQQRGTSGREDVLDTVISLSRPSDYDPREGAHFELHFSKARGARGTDVAPLDVRLEDVKGTSTLTWKQLEQSNEDKVRKYLEEGITSPADIAEAIGNISRVQVWRIKKKLDAKGIGV